MYSIPSYPSVVVYDLVEDGRSVPLGRKMLIACVGLVENCIGAAEYFLVLPSWLEVVVLGPIFFVREKQCDLSNC